MEEIKTIAKKWGNSVGVRLPKTIAERENIRDGTEIRIFVESASKMTVGTLMEFVKSLNLPKVNKSTDKVMKEIDKELWNEEW